MTSARDEGTAGSSNQMTKEPSLRGNSREYLKEKKSYGYFGEERQREQPAQKPQGESSWFLKVSTVRKQVWLGGVRGTAEIGCPRGQVESGHIAPARLQYGLWLLLQVVWRVVGAQRVLSRRLTGSDFCFKGIILVWRTDSRWGSVQAMKPPGR